MEKKLTKKGTKGTVSLCEKLEKIAVGLDTRDQLEVAIYSAELVLPIVKKYIPEETVTAAIIEQVNKMCLKFKNICRDIDLDEDRMDFVRLGILGGDLEVIYESRCKGFGKFNGIILQGIIASVHAFAGIGDWRIVSGVQLYAVYQATHCIAMGEALRRLEWTKDNIDKSFAIGQAASESVLNKIIDKVNEVTGVDYERV